MTKYIEVFPYLGIMFVMLFVFRKVFDKLTNFNDHDQMLEGNSAAAVNRGGAYLGYILAMSGSLIMSTREYGADLKMFFFDSLVALVLFVLAYFGLDLVVLRRIDNDDEVCRGNMAVAIVEACAYVSLGLIMSASFAGGGEDSEVQGMLSAALFSGLGLLTLLVLYVVYDVFWRKVFRRKVDREIEEGSLETALDVGTYLLSMGVVLLFSIVGDFSGWWQDIANYAVAAVDSIVVVAFARILAVVFLVWYLPYGERETSHGSVPKSLTIGFASIGSAVLVGLVSFG